MIRPRISQDDLRAQCALVRGPAHPGARSDLQSDLTSIAARLARTTLERSSSCRDRCLIMPPLRRVLLLQNLTIRARVSDPGSYHRVSAFPHARLPGCRATVAPLAGARARAVRCADSRPHRLSETGHALGRRRAPVLRDLGQDRNCQVAVTAALWGEPKARFVGAKLYRAEP